MNQLEEFGKETATGAAVGGTLGGLTSLAAGGVGLTALGTGIGIGVLGATGIGLVGGAVVTAGVWGVKRLLNR